jgi:hypothetical protein
MSTYQKHHRNTISTTKQKNSRRSTPKTPGHPIHSPTHTMQLRPTITNQQHKIQTQDQKSGAHLGITILRGVRAGARRRRTSPRGDLPNVLVNLVEGGVRC